MVCNLGTQMKKLLIPLLLFAGSVNAELYNWKVSRVIDGDTIEFVVDFLPAPLPNHVSVRVDGIDTPEKSPRSKCEMENDIAQQATEYTKERIAKAQFVQVNLKGWDKYGGRVLGDVFIDDANLAHELIEKGLAREYHGEAKSNWCD